MQLSLSSQAIAEITQRLAEANKRFREYYPGDPVGRRPVHTVYGGAHLFRADVSTKLGRLALRTMDEYAPNFAVFARVLGLPGAETLPEPGPALVALEEALNEEPQAVRRVNEPAWLAWTVYTRVRDKLQREPVEEYRIDFEDGYGYRPNEEEDHHAVVVGEQLAEGMAAGILPPFIGFRVKSFTPECYDRAVRTLDMVLTTLAARTGGKVPDNFVVTLPKVTIPAQVEALADLLELLEMKTGISPDTLKIDIMIEMTQAIINHRGENTVNLLVQAGKGRVVSAVFGTYDYTATCNITAHFQRHTHPASDFARHVLQVSLAGTGVSICDGATTEMPIGPHRATPDRPLTPQQQIENRRVVHAAWRLHYDNVRHSLEHGYYQGWDLNPAQLPIRYAAVYAFFLESLDDASVRLNAFIQQAAQATITGNRFDDAATGQGLLNFFLRGIACGALTEEEALRTGITLEELRGRSFQKIVENRARVTT